MNLFSSFFGTSTILQWRKYSPQRLATANSGGARARWWCPAVSPERGEGGVTPLLQRPKDRLEGGSRALKPMFLVLTWHPCLLKGRWALAWPCEAAGSSDPRTVTRMPALGHGGWLCGREVLKLPILKLFLDDCSEVQCKGDEVAVLGQEEPLPAWWPASRLPHVPASGDSARQFVLPAEALGQISGAEDLWPGKLVYPVACAQTKGSVFYHSLSQTEFKNEFVFIGS